MATPELTWGGDTNLTVGVSYAAALRVAGGAAVKITKVTGLPAGLSYKGGKVTGVPTKTGTFPVSVTVALSTNAKKTWTLKQPLVVEALSEWAKGSFNGCVGRGMQPVVGLASVFVGATGSISGKFQDGGTNWVLSAKSYTVRTEIAPGQDTFTCSNLVATYSWKVKSGKKTVTKSVTRKFVLTVGKGMNGDAELGFAGATEIEGDLSLESWQNRWSVTYKDVGLALFWTSEKIPSKTWASVAADGLGTYDTLSLKVTSAGAATATYKYFTGAFDKSTKAPQYATYTCSTALIPTSPADVDAFTGYAPIYLPPVAATGFPGFIAEVAYPFADRDVPVPEEE